MNRPIADDDVADKPLDPAVEQVRRRLVRFAVINSLILFAAIAVVIAALFWRSAFRGESGTGEPGTAPAQAVLALPAGSDVLSQSLAPDALSLLVALADGSRAILVYDRRDGRLLTRYALEEK